jgi:hypothetical protein
MHPGLALIDRNFWFWVSFTNIESNLHWRLLFFRDWFDHVNLLVHGDYTR